MLAVRPTRLLAAERAKPDHDRRPNATNEVLRKGQISSTMSIADLASHIIVAMETPYTVAESTADGLETRLGVISARRYLPSPS